MIRDTRVYSGGFRVVPRVPSFMKVLIILYYDKLTQDLTVGPVKYTQD